MSELRHDPLEDRWILVAPDRARRPRFHPGVPVVPLDPGVCPFCPGNESQTRPAIAVVDLGDDGPRFRRISEEVSDWWVRVVPNQYPMLQVERELTRTGSGLQQGQTGVGAHEVVIETPRHDADLADLDDDALGAVIETWRERIRDLYRDRRLVQAQVFRNHGALAGASVPHPHSQLTAMCIEPPRQLRHRLCMQDEYRRHGHRLLDRQWEEARTEGSRVLIDRDGVGVFAPWASPNRYEFVVLMPSAAPEFTGLVRDEARALASVLRELLDRMRRALGDPPTNLGLFVEPNHEALGTPVEGFRWHLRVVPRLSPMAGFEWMGEVPVNSTLPEDAVTHLSLASLEDDPGAEA